MKEYKVKKRNFDNIMNEKIRKKDDKKYNDAHDRI